MTNAEVTHHLARPNATKTACGLTAKGRAITHVIANVECKNCKRAIALAISRHDNVLTSPPLYNPSEGNY
jgi:hypothetical protein